MNQESAAHTDLLRQLQRESGDMQVLAPGSSAYDRATTPDNASFAQHPTAVVRPRTSAQVAAAITSAHRHGLRVVVQATGHGSGRELTHGALLVDTSLLDTITFDAQEQVAHVGAGATWNQVQRVAEPHGLLGLSGTSGGVGVSGYTFAGGVGWLVRPHGLAAGSLHSVDYVDGTGKLRRAADQADEQVDRDAIWAFRGGTPVGVATSLEIGLHPHGDLAAGYLLWPGSYLPQLAQAWEQSLAHVPDSVTSTLALLQLPPDGPFPPELLGTTVVHLSYATPEGAAALSPMRGVMRAVATPVVDTTGPSDAAALAQIHLDPPAGVPARGGGWWLRAAAAAHVAEIFGAAQVGAPDGLAMIEMRHVASSAPAHSGAVTRMPGEFLAHAVGPAPREEDRARVDTVLAAVEHALAPVTAGRTAPAFREGQPEAGIALEEAAQQRVLRTATQLDPQRLFSFQRGAV
ncbi:MAG TPA: FAD-binding protein [Ruania sp.]|nr:FAD-binding protein [Ruania sp.]